MYTLCFRISAQKQRFCSKTQILGTHCGGSNEHPRSVFENLKSPVTDLETTQNELEHFQGR